MRRPGRTVLFPLLALLAALGFPAAPHATVIGMNVIAGPVTRERVATLPKREQKAWLEYLNRSAKQKIVDKQTLAAEQKAVGNTNPQHAKLGFGSYALRSNHPDAWWTGSDALQAARNILTWQIPDGGRSKNIDVVARPRARRPLRRRQ